MENVNIPTEKDVCIQREELIDAISAIVNITAAAKNKHQEISKEIVYSSKDRIVHLTSMKKGSTSTVENAPYEADVFLIEGEVETTDGNGEATLLKNSTDRFKIKKGETSKGLAKKDSALITSIKLDTK